jgi:SAM-dependent methyltransferase
VPLPTFAFDLVRCVFAEGLVRGKVVLDAATGKGYGAYHLAKVGKAKKVIGVDLDEGALNYGRRTYRLANLCLEKMDVTRMDFPAAYFDVVVCFETLEHIAPARTRQFMMEVVRVLKPDGVFLISSPNRPVYSAKTHTRGHVNEMDYGELRNLLSGHFADCRFYVQGRNWLEHLEAKGPPGVIARVWGVLMSHLCWLRVPLSHSAVGRWVTEKHFAELLDERRVRLASSAGDVRGCLIQLAVCRNPRRSC